MIAVVQSPGVRVTVAESLDRYLWKVCEWYYLCSIKLNAGKTKTMILFRSRTINLQSPPLIVFGTVLDEVDDLDILKVSFDSKMTF